MHYRKVLAAFLVLALCLAGCGGGGTPSDADDGKDPETEDTDGEDTDDGDGEEEEEYPYDYTTAAFFNVENAIIYAPVAQLSGVKADGSYFDLPGKDGYDVQQGACTDGTYAYMVLENQKILDDAGNQVSWDVIYKIDMSTWEVVDQTEPLYLDHANDMTYNSKTNQLLVIHCYVNTNRISVIDADTMEFVESFDIDYGMFSICYNESRDQYVIGIKSTYDFAILDSDFKMVNNFIGVDPGYTKQGMDCDDDYIYFVMYEDNSLLCYNWNGVYCGCYRLKGLPQESEAMFNTNGNYYVTFYQGGHMGGRVAKVEFDKALLK